MEILVVIMIMGILAVIATANYLNALQLARQKRTMSDMRTIAQAWETRASEVKAYNGAGAVFTLPDETISHSQLQRILSPTYLREPPRLDGWGNPFDFGADQRVGAKAATTYFIRSKGRFGIADSDYDQTRTTNFDCDIIYTAGSFVVYPDGTGQQ